MYIKSIVLDGFKSYGKRVEITGFDTQFNAITGLNGTGKSNILDSICFVLGITNLGHVRASSLQDLIYKSGQAGVSKATVSITFDNSNRSQCPPGFEDFREISISRQVVMGGKNKYWINGSIVPNKKVQDLFCSVQLNVNNPHFLIMQGRVTKVLNMKPHEILAMVEEAAGTRMYENKRQIAQKTIDKKEAKLAELNSLFNEEIFPRLEKLRQERQVYLEFLRIERELEHLTALYQAWLYYETQRNTKKADASLKKFEQKVQDVRNKINENKRVADELENSVMEMSNEAEASSGTDIHGIEQELKSKEKEFAEATALGKSTVDNIKKEELKLKQLHKNREDDGAALKTKEAELAKYEKLFQTLKESDEHDNAAFVLSQKKFEAVSAGMEVDEEGATKTLHEQLMCAKQDETEALTTMKTANMEMVFMQNQLKEKEKSLGSSSHEYKRDMANLNNMQQEIDGLEAKLGQLSFSETRMNELQQRRGHLNAEIRRLRDNIGRISRPSIHFDYTDPEPNFNRRRVCGVVCRLFNVTDATKCIALETAAGGKLYQVIVEDDRTSKILLQRGQLRNRTTFIPLNKIEGAVMDNNVIKYAQELVGRDNVQPAMSLINYDRKLQPAMEYVFGNVFICKDMETARKITFNDRIRKKCVTLDGDVTDPGGTLSGGARQKGPSILQSIAEIQKFEADLFNKEEEFEAINNEFAQMSGGQKQHENLRERIDIKRHELETVTKRLQETTHHLQQREIDELKENIVSLTERVKECKKVAETNSKKAKELEIKMKDATGHRDRLLNNARAEMDKLQSKAMKSKAEWQKKEQDYNALTMEIKELKEGLENITTQISTGEELLVELKNQIETTTKQTGKLKELVTEVQSKLKETKAAIMARNREMQKKNNKKEHLQNQNSELELEIKKLDHDVKRLQDEYNNAKAKEADAVKNINKNDDRNLKEAEKLSEQDGHELHNKISKFREKRNALSRTVNTKAQSMFEHEEKQYNFLLNKKRTVEADRNHIRSVIDELDKQKMEALQLAFTQVSKDFGSIFSTLLPGANAKLVVPKGKSLLEGLEVKVSLGGVWKESLSELSGGQRSLVALSLILAMLLFKPAPLYILDEVDAALDLSHTQNIGHMLKTHFKQSQFIIVSLKDGMFNNANVLFRTKFIDGMSAVMRTVNRMDY